MVIHAYFLIKSRGNFTQERKCTFWPWAFLLAKFHRILGLEGTPSLIQSNPAGSTVPKLKNPPHQNEQETPTNGFLIHHLNCATTYTYCHQWRFRVSFQLKVMRMFYTECQVTSPPVQRYANHCKLWGRMWMTGREGLSSQATAAAAVLAPL